MSDRFQLHFVGVGPQRTGSTWLDEVLRRHPAVCMPRNVKETMFFDLHYQKGWSWYAWHFDHSRDCHCGEVGPTYFDLPEVPGRILDESPGCRILISLRDPVARTASLYRHHYSKGRANGSLREAVEEQPRILTSGHYSRHIPRWVETFGRERVDFVLLDDVKSRPARVWEDLCQFLDLPRAPMPEVAEERMGAARMPRFRAPARIASRVVNWMRGRRLHRVVEIGKTLGLNDLVYTGGENHMPRISETDQAWLRDFFEEDITFVESLLDRRLPSWRGDET